MRKKPNLIPRMEKCSEYQIKEPENLLGNWLSSNGNKNKLYVELGCGKGRFTIETAKTLDDTLFVAIERVPEAMVMAMERAKAENLSNVLFIDMDAARLETVFSPGEVDRIYINFCDPWPGGKKYAKRRLTAPGFLELYRKILVSGGEIHFKTDNLPLFEYSLEQFTLCGFSVSQVTRNLHENGPQGIMTDYECKFYKQGIKINRCVAALIPQPEGHAAQPTE